MLSAGIADLTDTWRIWVDALELVNPYLAHSGASIQKFFFQVLLFELEVFSGPTGALARIIEDLGDVRTSFSPAVEE